MSGGSTGDAFLGYFMKAPPEEASPSPGGVMMNYPATVAAVHMGPYLAEQWVNAPSRHGGLRPAPSERVADGQQESHLLS